MPAEAVHLEGNWVGWLSPETELEEIELGDRVCDFLTDWMLIAAFGREEDRIATGVRQLSGEVATATSWRGLPFPPEWWPRSAGEIPPELARGRGPDASD